MITPIFNPGMKSKSLIILIVLLLLANAALLYLYLNKNREPKKESRRTAFREQLKKEVGFSDEQMTRFEKLREEQRRNMEPMMDSMGRLRTEMFNLSAASNNDSAIAGAIARLSEFQGKIDWQMVKNFRDARSICTPAQTARFDSAMKKMMVSGGRKKPGPPNEKR